MSDKAFNKFGITTELRKLLISNEELTTMVGGNIYPIIAPLNTNGDIIIYYRDGYGKEYVQGNLVVKDNCKVFFAVISENYDRSIKIAELLNDIIEGQHFNKDDYSYTCRLVDSTEDFEDKKYLQILLFDIK